jgi:hypothetical protein
MDKTTGQERSKPVVVVNSLELLGSKPAGDDTTETEEVPF